MRGITTHVLDTSIGRPAAGIQVHLARERDGAWEPLGTGETDGDGRVRELIDAGTALIAGTYRLVLHTGDYFSRTARTTFYPHVVIVFEVAEGEAHYHVPLLISPFGYSTYRGS